MTILGYIANFATLAIFMLIGRYFERKRVANRLRERAAGLTIQASVELKMIADELDGK